MSAQHTPGPWRIVRNEKMHFAVARETEDGTEHLRSASGRPSSFKTWAGAQRALRSLQRAAA